MPVSLRKFRLGLQAKVLMPMMAVLILLPLVTLWIVGSRMQQQMEDEALRTLTTAEAVFVKSLDNRSRTFVTHYRSVADEARVRITAGLGDSRTLDALLADIMANSSEDEEAIMFFNLKGERLAARRRSSAVDLEKFASAAEPVIHAALAEDSGVRNIALDQRAFSLISVPVFAPNDGTRLGVLLAGVRIEEAAIKELKLPRTEILLLANDRPIVSTSAELPESLGREARGTHLQTLDPLRGQNAQSVVVGGEHFMARSGPLDPSVPAGTDLRYVMLSSYERRFRALEETRRTLVEVSVIAMLVSLFVVSWLVRRAIRPLHELRDGAEAVGRGDFSRRIRQFSDDECGDLAVSFNQMSGNLQESRAELEKAVETLKNTQTQLIQSEKLSAVSQFVAGVAHELNNPLTVVIGFSDLISQTATEKKIQPQLQMIVKSAHRCHKIVQNLLSFARQHPPERKLVRLNEAIDEVLEIMAYDLRTSNVKVVREFAENLPAIMADTHQLQQVFINIISNARQAIQPFRRDGSIVIRALTDGPWLRVVFQDNGPGIRPEHLSRIFDPFFTTKPVGKGTGLGMSLSYGIINEHRGKISVQSQLGDGATFVIDLPVAVERDGLRHGVDPVGLLGTQSSVPQGKSVLVVDDEEAILTLSSALLREQGYHVQTAAAGETAITCLERQPFDVIVCDWKMPGLNGIQLYQHLREKDPLSASRMLFMTGDVISDTFQEFLVGQSKVCLTKPFAIEDFRTAVADLASLARV